MPRHWFTSRECSALEIRMHKSISVPQVVTAVTIEDSKVIQAIMARIESISVAGDMMISFGPDAEYIELLFRDAGGIKQKLGIYQKRFKTPSTGFHGEPEEAESTLYADIDALLFPAIDKVMLKTRDLDIDFGPFSLTWLGETQSETAPVSASWVANRFLLKDKAGQSQVLKIISGQMSPPTHDFDVDQQQFVLLTYETQTKQRLYPDYFQVITRLTPSPPFCRQIQTIASEPRKRAGK